MNVSYAAPLQRAWARTRRVLFVPFRLEIWVVLGFAAFLSELFSGHGGPQYTWHDRAELPHRIGRLPELFVTPLLIWIGAVAVVAVLVVLLVLLWVSCRGKFIFLDNVVHERTGIVEPWKRYKRLGNSLFAWTIVFGIVCLLIGALMLLPFIATIIAMFHGGEFRWAGLGALFGLFIVAVPLLIAYAYVVLFLSDFVVPIMYRHDLTATAAWGRFVRLLRQHPGSFLLYGLFVFVLWAAVILAWMVVGFSTCCVGFLLLALPYVGTVLLLPVYVTFRGLGPEFLAQFGPDYALFAASAGGGSPGPGAPAPSGGASTG